MLASASSILRPQLFSLLRRQSHNFRTYLSTMAGETLNPLPASFLRGGTSKGIFVHEKYLPGDRSHWEPIFLGLMGSPDPQYAKQLNGMGGGATTLSKVCVVGPPSEEQARQGIHAQYTFVQVGIRDSTIHFAGNCGNLSSMIGVFAVDEGICKPKVKDGLMTVRSFNTNTQKIVDTTFPATSDGVPVLDLPQAIIAGVFGTASRIVVDFVDPGGARTGKLLPTGNTADVLEVSDGGNPLSFTASLVDAANPSVFLSYDELVAKGLPMDDYCNGVQPSATRVGGVLESLRQEGAKKMGLDPSSQAQPKISFVRPPNRDAESDSHIFMRTLSMGGLHQTIPLSIGVCVGVASKIENTIPWRIYNETSDGSGAEFVNVRHVSGVIDVQAEFNGDEVTNAKVIRTGRRLMKGEVYW